MTKLQQETLQSELRCHAKNLLESILENFYVDPKQQVIAAYQVAVISRSSIGISEPDCDFLREKFNLCIKDEQQFTQSLCYLQTHYLTDLKLDKEAQNTDLQLIAKPVAPIQTISHNKQFQNNYISPVMYSSINTIPVQETKYPLQAKNYNGNDILPIPSEVSNFQYNSKKMNLMESQLSRTGETFNNVEYINTKENQSPMNIDRIGANNGDYQNNYEDDYSGFNGLRINGSKQGIAQGSNLNTLKTQIAQSVLSNSILNNQVQPTEMYSKEGRIQRLSYKGPTQINGTKSFIPPTNQVCKNPYTTASIKKAYTDENQTLTQAVTQFQYTKNTSDHSDNLVKDNNLSHLQYSALSSNYSNNYKIPGSSQYKAQADSSSKLASYNDQHFRRSFIPNNLNNNISNPSQTYIPFEDQSSQFEKSQIAPLSGRDLKRSPTQYDSFNNSIYSPKTNTFSQTLNNNLAQKQLYGSPSNLGYNKSAIYGSNINDATNSMINTYKPSSNYKPQAETSSYGRRFLVDNNNSTNQQNSQLYPSTASHPQYSADFKRKESNLTSPINLNIQAKGFTGGVSPNKSYSRFAQDNCRASPYSNINDVNKSSYNPITADRHTNSSTTGYKNLNSYSGSSCGDNTNTNYRNNFNNQSIDYKSPISNYNKFGYSNLGGQSPLQNTSSSTALNSPGVYNLLMKKRSKDLVDETSTGYNANNISSVTGRNNYTDTGTVQNSRYSPRASPSYYKMDTNGNYSNKNISSGRVFGVDNSNSNAQGYSNRLGSNLNTGSNSGFTSPLNSGYKAYKNNYNNYGSGGNSPGVYNKPLEQENQYQSPSVYRPAAKSNLGSNIGNYSNSGLYGDYQARNVGQNSYSRDNNNMRFCR